MKVSPEDPRLSAYLLGELSSEESVSIEHAAAADPAIRLSLDELGKMVGFLDQALGEGNTKRLLPPQRESIRRAIRDADSGKGTMRRTSSQRSRLPWLGAVAAAAVVALGVLLMSRFDLGSSGNRAGNGGWMSDDIALLPMPGPNAAWGGTNVGGANQPLMEQREMIESRPSEFLMEVARHLENRELPEAAQLPATSSLGGFGRGPETRLPIVIGTTSLQWVKTWIRERKQLPPRNAVRVEELINTGFLPGGSVEEGLRLSIEVMPCPWSEKSKLVAVQIAAMDESIHDLKLILRSNAEHRLLGSFLVRSDSRLPTVLPEGRSTLVMLEVETDPDALPAKLEIHRGDQLRSSWVLDLGVEPSAGMRHAVTLAGFGLWLRGEGVDNDGLRRLLELAKDGQDPVYTDVRRMMREALVLADVKR
jgi:hypothetical protein